MGKPIFLFILLWWVFPGNVNAYEEFGGAIGVGIKYGGIVGGQVSAVRGSYKFNGAVGVLGGSIGVERNLGYRQSIGVTGGFFAFSGAVVSTDYSVYVLDDMFSGLALTISYEKWWGENVSENRIRGSVGYHF